MAELFSLPIACLHEVPAGVPDQAAVFAEPLAAALEILEQSHMRPTERVAVVGDGKLGLLCAQVLRLPGCEVVVVGRHPERWELLHDWDRRCIRPNRTRDRSMSWSIAPASRAAWRSRAGWCGRAAG